MQRVKLNSALFPDKEKLEYYLKMVGARGQVHVYTKKNSNSVEIKCQVLASLLFPPKKLVDSEIVSRLEVNPETDAFSISKYIDNDFKTEARRTLELKKHGIETRYSKFEEERGYLDYPKDIEIQEIVDPLSMIFALRVHLKGSSTKSLHVPLLLRTGIINLNIKELTREQKVIEGFGDRPRELVKIGFEAIGGEGKLRDHFWSPDLEVWVDSETGILSEISYAFLGNFGKATLLLSKIEN